MNELFEHDELPYLLKKINISAYSRHPNYGNKTIRIAFYTFSISLTIEGVDQTWVLGTYARINEYVAHKRVWYWWIIKLLPFSSGVIPTLGTIKTVELLKSNHPFYAIEMMTISVAWVTIVALQYKGIVMPYSQITISPKDNILNKDNISFAVTILGLVVSIVGSLIIPLINN